MLDYKFIKDNLDAVKQNIINRNMTADADKVVELFDKRTALVTKLQGLQQKRNENAQAMKQKLDPEKRNELIAAGKAIKDEITSVEAETKETEAALEEAARQIPNMVHPDAPVGKLDTENLEVKKVGTPRKFDFEPKDHVQLGESLDIIDFDRGTKVSGPKFYYLKNEAVFLEQALIMYALNTLRKHNFQMFITPDVAKEEVLKGIGLLRKKFLRESVSTHAETNLTFTQLKKKEPVWLLLQKSHLVDIIRMRFWTRQAFHVSTADFHTVSAAKQVPQVSSLRDSTAFTSLIR